MQTKDIIKLKRKELNLTLEELGKKVGVGKSTIRKWETGMISNMKSDNIAALATALNISIPVLMGFEEPKIEASINPNPEFLTLWNKLNDIGQAKTLAYMEGMLENKKYQKKRIIKKTTILQVWIVAFYYLNILKIALIYILLTFSIICMLNILLRKGIYI